MKEPSERDTQYGALALHTRRKFLKKALITAAYVAPVVLSYSSAVFAAHCTDNTCGGADHEKNGMFWSPGCSMLN
ncbi:MAG: hypothetical protein HYY89_03770 [candidate division NC10 bacterium]|nr:hypothetical protein [candidate division NC10 bacterium]